jgi:hypothetical protein
MLGQKIRAGLFSALLLPMAVMASLAELEEFPDAEQIGEGKLRWLGMTVYEARLFARDGAYLPQQPHALKIEYRYSFTAEQLARQSLKEIERIHGEQPDGNGWRKALQAVFRDVERGDHIIGVHYPGRGAEFYSEGELLGRLENVELSRAFFDIWLDPRTSEPKLRRQLLGDNR